MSIHIPAIEFENGVASAADRSPHYSGPLRTFDLPVRLHILTASIFLAYLGVMAFAFGGGENAIPMVICAIIVAASFITPGLWATMHGSLRGKAASWDEFSVYGVETLTGRVNAFDASVQVLILPVLIFLWGVVIVAYAAMLT